MIVIPGAFSTAKKTVCPTKPLTSLGLNSVARDDDQYTLFHLVSPGSHVALNFAIHLPHINQAGDATAVGVRPSEFPGQPKGVGINRLGGKGRAVKAPTGTVAAHCIAGRLRIRSIPEDAVTGGDFKVRRLCDESGTPSRLTVTKCCSPSRFAGRFAGPSLIRILKGAGSNATRTPAVVAHK